jgi:ABC-type sugar transport system ATPase subunit
MTQDQPIIQFNGITKAYGGVQALKNVSFSIPRGGIHALVGENGAGKSTLIKVAGGIVQPDAGTIFFDSTEVDFRSPLEAERAGIGIVHQEIPMCPHLSAAENIFLSRELPKRRGLIDWNAVHEQTRELFRLFDTNIDPKAVVGRLPISQQQMIEIAKALSHESRLIIMDEPTSALGKKETNQLFRIIENLVSQGITIIYVSHRLEEVFEIADTVTALRDGEFINTSSINQVTPDDVVNMMVGREIEDLFPKVYNQIGNKPLLSVRNLNQPEKFDDVSFDLYPGEVLGLVGLQGSGTSEVMRALFGYGSNITGEIMLQGKPITINNPLEAIRHGIAYIPADRQGEGLFRVMSVRDNGGLLILRRIAKLFGFVPNRELNKQALSAVREFNIRAASIHSLVSSLSGGNQQKVVVAKALSTSPLVILMDDPTRGVDVGAKAEIHEILNQIVAAGNAIILVSSELPEVLAMSDRVLVMYRGTIKATLPHDEADRDLVMSLATGVGEMRVNGAVT